MNTSVRLLKIPYLLLSFYFFLFLLGDVQAQENLQRLEPSPQKLEMIKEKFSSFEDNYTATETYSFTYLSDGLKVKGYMSIPRAEGKFPIVIFNRGGNRDFGELKDLGALIMLNEIAAQGYVVFASNYRGSTDSEGMEEFGGADVNDILNLIPIAQKNEKADPERIGMIGWSRGGMMTYRALMETCELKAAVVGAGIANMFRSAEERPEMESGVFTELIPDFEENRDEALKSRSAVYNIDRICADTPILLLHGSSDWRVSPKDAFQMADSLYAHKRPFRMHIYEGADHGISEFKAEVMDEMIQFLNDYLKGERDAPNMEPHGR